jgi:hypothetical protein
LEKQNSKEMWRGRKELLKKESICKINSINKSKTFNLRRIYPRIGV